MIKQLREKHAKDESTESQFFLSDQVYAKGIIPPTDKVTKNSTKTTFFMKTGAGWLSRLKCLFNILMIVDLWGHVFISATECVT